MTNEELNEQIAEKVMGWTEVPRGSWSKETLRLQGRGNGRVWKPTNYNRYRATGYPVPFGLPFDPATDIDHAFEVVDKLSATHDLQLFGARGGYAVLFVNDSTPNSTNIRKAMVSHSNTAPHAICLAALEAVK